MIVQPGDGHQLPGGVTRPVVKVGPQLGSERLCVLESEIPSGGGFPPHVHDAHEESFYVKW